MRPSRVRRSATAGVVVAAVSTVSLAGCSSGDHAPEPSAADRLAAAKRTLDSTSSVRLHISSSDFPSRAEGVSAVEGVATHQPAFQGTLTMRAKGLSGKVDVVSVDGQLQLRLPFTQSFVKTDPAEYNAPDPASLLSPDKGISSLITATTGPALGAKKRDGARVLQTVTGTIPGAKVVEVLATGDRSKSFAATYTISDEDQVTAVSVKGPFFPGVDTTYDVRLDGYGQQVTVSAP